MKAAGRLKDIYWGWLVVAGVFCVLVASYGSRYRFGVFVHPMFMDRQWPMSAISLAFSINLMIYALGGLVSGRLLDLMAPRWIMTIRACIFAISFVATGFVQTPGQLYMTYGALCGIGSAGIGGTVGPVLGGIIYDMSGSCIYAWRLNIVVRIIISLLMLGLKPKRTGTGRNTGKRD